MGRDRTAFGWKAHIECFNSRARMGRDPEDTTKSTVIGVSIHAPAWGATRGADSFALYLEVSIHAPAWGATTLAEIKEAMGEGFNSRARMGRDKVYWLETTEVKVSIHAPAWGAT